MNNREKAEYHRNMARYYEGRSQDYLRQAKLHKDLAEANEAKAKSFEQYDELDY